MHPKRYSQIERALSILDKAAALDFIKDNQYLIFLFKKTERIVAAFFMMTGILPETEPLKSEIRSSGLALIKDMMSFRTSAGLSHDFAGEFISRATRALSLLEIGYIAELISPMNFSVLKKEIEGLCALLETKGKMSAEPYPPTLFDERFFGVPDVLVSAERASGSAEAVRRVQPVVEAARRIFTPGKQARNGEIVKDIHKGHDTLKDSKSYRTSSGETGTQRREEERMIPRPFHKGHISLLIHDKIKKERTAIILALLRKKGSVVVKDFGGIIEGCGEKTVQRLLSLLAVQGVLKKEGKRRWSRYSLQRQQAPDAPIQQVKAEI